MSHKVIAEFYHPKLGETIQAGAPFPGGLSAQSIEKLVRARCLKPLPVSDTPQPAGRSSQPAEQAGTDQPAKDDKPKPARRPCKKKAEGGQAAALFPEQDSEAVAGENGGGDRDGAELDGPAGGEDQREG